MVNTPRPPRGPQPPVDRKPERLWIQRSDVLSTQNEKPFRLSKGKEPNRIGAQVRSAAGDTPSSQRGESRAPAKERLARGYVRLFHKKLQIRRQRTIQKVADLKFLGYAGLSFNLRGTGQISDFFLSFVLFCGDFLYRCRCTTCARGRNTACALKFCRVILSLGDAEV